MANFTEVFPLLSLLIFFPLGGAFLLALLPQNGRSVANSRALAVWLSGLHVALSFFVLWAFDTTQTEMQLVEHAPWLPFIDVFYYVGIDGLSVLFLPLTSLLTLCAVLVSWKSITERPQYFYACLLAMNGLVTGVFCALDLVLFYVFWEAMLIPMFLLIGLWGGKERVYATLKFFLYTFAGSVLMLGALVYVYVSLGTFDILAIQGKGGMWESHIQLIVWLAFFIAFAVKIPMWPLHTWLPDAHVQAPTAGSVLLAGILLKMGGYGFLRILMPMLPFMSQQMAPFMYALSVIAILWAALVAFAQTDVKKMIAYSSVSHMGFVTLGMFTGTAEATQGAVLQMVNHGIVSAALFMCIGVVYDRLHTRDLAKLGGIATVMPYFAMTFGIFMLSSVALPGTNSFIGEFLILAGSFGVTQWATMLATVGVVLGATYMLKLTRGMLFGEIKNAAVKTLKDVDMREKMMFAPLVFFVFFIGLFPNVTLRYLQPWIEVFSYNQYAQEMPTYVVPREISKTLENGVEEAPHAIH